MTSSSSFDQTPRSSEGPVPTIHRRLYRSRSNRILSGVCGGIAEYYGADPTAVRLLTVVIALFTALVPVFLLYLVAAVLVPVRTGADGPAETPTGGVAVSPLLGSLGLGIVLIGFGLVALANQLFRIEWEVLWPVALIALGAALVVANQRR
jgi:phage shock protein C